MLDSNIINNGNIRNYRLYTLSRQKIKATGKGKSKEELKFSYCKIFILEKRPKKSNFSMKHREVIIPENRSKKFKIKTFLE